MITEISQRRISLPKDFTSRSNQRPTEKPTDILPKLPTEIGTEKSTKNAPKPKTDSLQTKLKPKPNYVSNHREISITIPNHDYTATEPR
jgi:hypothetical protein